MKVLVLGANGMAGHMIATYLQEKGHEVVGFVRRSENICEEIVGDALNKEDIVKALKFKEFDFVINAIGVLNKAVDARLSEGIYLNSVLPHFIAETLKNSRTKLIHISSDCVFQGSRGNYNENDEKDAESFYGKTKSLGEVIDSSNLTFRTSIVGPEIKRDGVGLLHWFMSQVGEVNGFTDVYWTGVTTLQLAQAIEASFTQEITGVYHLVNGQKISKYELLNLFNHYINDDKMIVHQNGSFYSDKSLINNRKDFSFTIPSYEAMIIELSTWMREHRELYKLYE